MQKNELLRYRPDSIGLWNLLADEICGYTVYKWRSDLPFKVILLDRRTGDAKLVLAEGEQLDYELKRKYSFDIAAYDCETGNHAHRSAVFIRSTVIQPLPSSSCIHPAGTLIHVTRGTEYQPA